MAKSFKWSFCCFVAKVCSRQLKSIKYQLELFVPDVNENEKLLFFSLSFFISFCVMSPCNFIRFWNPIKFYSQNRATNCWHLRNFLSSSHVCLQISARYVTNAHQLEFSSSFHPNFTFETPMRLVFSSSDPCHLFCCKRLLEKSMENWKCFFFIIFIQ